MGLVDFRSITLRAATDIAIFPMILFFTSPDFLMANSTNYLTLWASYGMSFNLLSCVMFFTKSANDLYLGKLFKKSITGLLIIRFLATVWTCIFSF